jgi:beta-glucosidase
MSTVGEWFAHPVGGPLLQAALVQPAEVAVDETMQAMMLGFPAKTLADFGLAGFDQDTLDGLVRQVRASH